MPALPILTYPDKRLRETCQDVADFQDPDLQVFIDDILETMQVAPACVGVAAPQVGHLIQLVVINCGLARKPPKAHHGELVLINPAILTWNGLEVGREGCLSLPDYTANVIRATDISVQFQDRDGREHALGMRDFEARVVQHEMDHLQGKLFLDRIVSRKADLFKRKRYR
ncbi:MAG: peptide deformylase [Magnetococcales bacterium]|nr:peptide deformylase [Magnetococcales bacterium]